MSYTSDTLYSFTLCLISGEWKLAPQHQSCNAACAIQKLQCTQQAFSRAHELVSTQAGLEQVMASVGQVCKSVDARGASGPAFTPKSQACHLLATDSQVQCLPQVEPLQPASSDTTAMEPRQQLCWCSLPGAEKSAPRRVADGWREAQYTCASVGSRLCAVDELAESTAADGACGHSAALVWTEEQCNNAPDGMGHVISPGSHTVRAASICCTGCSSAWVWL